MKVILKNEAPPPTPTAHPSCSILSINAKCIQSKIHFFSKNTKNSKNPLAPGEFTIFASVSNPMCICLGGMFLAEHEPFLPTISLIESHLYNT